MNKKIVPSYEDWQAAYEEAAGHVEYIAGVSKNQLPEGEREAMRQLSKRLRNNAQKLIHKKHE